MVCGYIFNSSLTADSLNIFISHNKMESEWDTADFKLSSAVLKTLHGFNFTTITPVQKATIPLLINYKDVCVEAVTGSGKTLAFLIPIVEILLRCKDNFFSTKDGIYALIVSPTRELATQISDVLSEFLKQKEMNFFRQALFVGGTNIEDDIRVLKTERPSIIISTPGRLEDLLLKTIINLPKRIRNLEILILDEADRLLDLGFRKSLDTILSYLPKQRRTGIFSATQTTDVIDLIRAGLRNPVFVTIKQKSDISTPILLNNFFKIIEPEKKLIELIAFLKTYKPKKALLFLPTCACVEYWTLVLPHVIKVMEIIGIHGKMKHKRHKIIKKFREKENVLLLCTDVFARGLDIPQLDWVIQWDPPSNATAFVHRVGRTARQGSSGNALVFLLSNEECYVDFLKINQKVQMKNIDFSVEEEDLNNINNVIHKLQVKDRLIYDKANQAFVSHIRAYSKHECNAILRVKDLNLAKVATSYGLLHLPRMPEMKNVNKMDFKGPEENINTIEISYKNKQREHSRQAKLQILKETGNWPGKKKFKKKTLSWSLTKELRNEVKSKKARRKEKKLKKDKTNSNKSNIGKRKISKDELEELANDIRLFKKLKKNKISEEEFNLQIGINEL